MWLPRVYDPLLTAGAWPSSAGSKAHAKVSRPHGFLLTQLSYPIKLTIAPEYELGGKRNAPPMFPFQNAQV